jgi:hypothetical protein
MLSELISSFFCAPALEQEPPRVQPSLREINTESPASPVLDVVPRIPVESKQDVHPRVRQRLVRLRGPLT